MLDTPKPASQAEHDLRDLPATQSVETAFSRCRSALMMAISSACSKVMGMSR